MRLCWPRDNHIFEAIFGVGQTSFFLVSKSSFFACTSHEDLTLILAANWQ